jgi:serine/threonine protein kinase
MDEALARGLGARLGAALGDQFEIGELIGAGGFAAVFRARDPLLGRDVAIKVLDPSVARDPAASDRLLDEARMVATIEHPHIVPLYEAGRRDGLVFLVMSGQEISPRPRSPDWASKSPTRWRRHTPAGSSISTSSRTTFCWTPAGTRR